MSLDPSTKRSLAPIVIALVMILAGGSLIAGVLATRPHDAAVDTAGARRDALAACTSFEPVYDATAPGAAVDENRLAAKLDAAIASMNAAAKKDKTWKPLADELNELGNAVNASDADRAAPALGNIHRGCEAAKSAS